jgi:hypothetical protein
VFDGAVVESQLRAVILKEALKRRGVVVVGDAAYGDALGPLRLERRRMECSERS